MQEARSCAFDYWNEFCSSISAKEQETAEVFNWLDRFYNEPGRHYHNWSHITDCVSKLYKYRESMQSLPYAKELEYALWFHDVIYSFGFQNSDEEASAKFACICAEKLGIVNNIDLFIVSSLISMTKDHEPDIRPYIEFKDAEYIMSDIDLSIFSEDESVVDRYDAAIRNEYFWVPFDDFSKGRVEALKKYYYRDKIYFSLEGLSNLKAKANLKRLIEKYGS